MSSLAEIQEAIEKLTCAVVDRDARKQKEEWQK